MGGDYCTGGDNLHAESHIKGAHEGVKYYFKDCDYKATHCT